MTEPEVSTSTARTVVVELDPDAAELLARILIQYGAVMSSIAAGVVDPVDGYEKAPWDRTAIDLLANAASLGVPAEMIPVARYIPPGSQR